jgi:hypothetical protein
MKRDKKHIKLFIGILYSKMSAPFNEQQNDNRIIGMISQNYTPMQIDNMIYSKVFNVPMNINATWHNPTPYTFSSQNTGAKK